MGKLNVIDMNNFKLDFFSSLNQKFNSGELKPINNAPFRKVTIGMLQEALKEIYKKSKKNKSSNYVIINSQISDELYTWDVVMNNK